MLCWQNCVLLLCVLTLSANNWKLACSRAIAAYWERIRWYLRLSILALYKCAYWLIDWLIDWLMPCYCTYSVCCKCILMLEWFYISILRTNNQANDLTVCRKTTILEHCQFYEMKCLLVWRTVHRHWYVCMASHIRLRILTIRLPTIMNYVCSFLSRCLHSDGMPPAIVAAGFCNYFLQIFSIRRVAVWNLDISLYKRYIIYQISFNITR